jgi:hypothetical protein
MDISRHPEESTSTQRSHIILKQQYIILIFPTYHLRERRSSIAPRLNGITPKVIDDPQV